MNNNNKTLPPRRSDGWYYVWLRSGWDRDQMARAVTIIAQEDSTSS